MAIKIEGTQITMTRGDTLKLYVIPQYEDGSEYEPAENDTIRFAMKRRYEDTKVLLTKEISTEDFLLHLKPEDTKELKFGHYVYDIQLTHENGDVDTYINKGELILSEEVD